MTEAFDTQDLNILIHNLNDLNTELLNDTLQKLILFCQSYQKNKLPPHFQSLFNKFSTLLRDENLSIIVQTSQLLIEIVTQFPEEAEKYYETVMESLIMNLADSKVCYIKYIET